MEEEDSVAPIPTSSSAYIQYKHGVEPPQASCCQTPVAIVLEFSSEYEGLRRILRI